MAYQKVTFAELKLLGMNRLGNVAFYTEDEVGIYLNEALRVWNLITWQWHGSVFIPTVASQTFYDVSASVLKTMRVEYNNVPLDLTSLQSLDLGQPGWQGTAAGTPKRWFPVALTQIGIYPTDAIGGNSLRVEGVLTTPVLVNESDYLDLGQWQVQALLDYVHHLATFKQGGEEFKASLQTLKSFMTAAGVQNRKFAETALYKRYMGMDLDELLRPMYRGGPQSDNRSAASE